MMHVHEARFPGSCARRLGIDRNPLRRGTDRVEAAIRLVIIALLVIAVPVVAVVAGRQADHQAVRQAQAQRAADHLVTAVLLERAQATGVPDPYTNVQMTYVLARWQPPGRLARTGDVLATAGALKGSTAQIWINASGALTAPPPDQRTIAGDVCMAVIVTCLTSVAVLLVLGALTRFALDRRRMRGWEAEWRATGPLWSGRRR
ncbi:MAG: Rv1733c family protein [Streptosporangiaceae bacterium]